MHDDLDDLRELVNKLDDQLLALLNQRAETALRIGEVKDSTGKKVYDPVRERAVLERLTVLNKGPLSKGAIEEVFACIITACREIQIR